MRVVTYILTAVLTFMAVNLEAASLIARSAERGDHQSLIGDALFYLGLGSSVAVFGATLGTNALTLADWAKRLDPDGKVPTIVELLAQTNDILADQLWIEGNLPTGHRTTVRTGLPTVAWRLLNAGVTPSKSTTAQIDEQAGMLEAWSEVDLALLRLNGGSAEFRLSEGRAFIEAMNQEMASTLFYGNGGLAPEEFTGLSPRYSAISGADNAQNVITGGGAGSDNASIWLIVWGDQTVHGIFPKGSKAGLEHNDYGEVTVEVTAGVAGQRMRAMQERWVWNAGVAVKDWRYAVRICNIDISALIAQSSAADLTSLMVKAMYRIPTMGMGKPAFYMNRTCAQMLDIFRRDDVIAGGQLSYENVDGKRIMSFRGVPIRVCDALLENEATVA